MTTKELIRQEIERRKVAALYKGFTFVHAALQDLLSFLDTMPDEPVTDCHDLKEAAAKYANRGISSNADPYEEIIAYQADKDAFIAGAKWQKAKMMEGAVEGLICATITGTNAISFLSPLPKELKAGDEVSVIILPKEEE